MNLLDSFVLDDVAGTDRELGRGIYARAFEVHVAMDYGGASYVAKEILSVFMDRIDSVSET